MDRKQNYDKLKRYQKKYYERNKDKIYEQHTEWRANNREKLVKCAVDSRKRRIERLKEEGVLNPWGVVMRGSKPRYKKEI